LLHPFSFRDAVAAGSLGRLIMTLFIYAGPFIGMPKTDIIGILGSLVTRSKEEAATLGGLIHLTMGCIFALIYVALWSLGIGSDTWWWGVIFGTIHGILVLLVTPLLMHIHPPLLHIIGKRLDVPMMIQLLIAHMFYGLMVAVIYSLGGR
jgi:hypothetical protein